MTAVLPPLDQLIGQDDGIGVGSPSPAVPGGVDTTAAVLTRLGATSALPAASAPATVETPAVAETPAPSPLTDAELRAAMRAAVPTLNGYIGALQKLLDSEKAKTDVLEADAVYPLLIKELDELVNQLEQLRAQFAKEKSDISLSDYPSLAWPAYQVTQIIDRCFKLFEGLNAKGEKISFGSNSCALFANLLRINFECFKTDDALGFFTLSVDELFSNERIKAAYKWAMEKKITLKKAEQKLKKAQDSVKSFFGSLKGRFSSGSEMGAVAGEVEQVVEEATDDTTVEEEIKVPTSTRTVSKQINRQLISFIETKLSQYGLLQVLCIERGSELGGGTLQSDLKRLWNTFDALCTAYISITQDEPDSELCDIYNQLLTQLSKKIEDLQKTLVPLIAKLWNIDKTAVFEFLGGEITPNLFMISKTEIKGALEKEENREVFLQKRMQSICDKYRVLISFGKLASDVGLAPLFNGEEREAVVQAMTVGSADELRVMIEGIYAELEKQSIEQTARKEQMKASFAKVVEKEKAATTIQKVFRGYRVRREKGYDQDQEDDDTTPRERTISPASRFGDSLSDSERTEQRSTSPALSADSSIPVGDSTEGGGSRPGTPGSVKSDTSRAASSVGTPSTVADDEIKVKIAGLEELLEQYRQGRINYKELWGEYRKLVPDSKTIPKSRREKLIFDEQDSQEVKIVKIVQHVLTHFKDEQDFRMRQRKAAAVLKEARKVTEQDENIGHIRSLFGEDEAWKEAEEERERKASEKRAATTIQRHVRGILVRNRIKKEREEEQRRVREEEIQRQEREQQAREERQQRESQQSQGLVDAGGDGDVSRDADEVVQPQQQLADSTGDLTLAVTGSVDAETPLPDVSTAVPKPSWSDRWPRLAKIINSFLEMVSPAKRVDDDEGVSADDVQHVRGSWFSLSTWFDFSEIGILTESKKTTSTAYRTHGHRMFGGVSCFDGNRSVAATRPEAAAGFKA